MPRSRMPVLAPGLAWVDLKFRRSPNVIATAVVSDAGGVTFIDRDMRRHLSEADILPHRVGAPFEVSWLGLARYWRKKGL